MKNNTICCNPVVYRNIAKPNTLDLNNSFATKEELLNNQYPMYKRDGTSNCYEALVSVISRLYDVPSENCMLVNSGVAAANMLSLSKRFKRILLFKNTYVEMKEAYGICNEVLTFDENFKDFHKDDLVCFETISVPDCEEYDYKTIAKKAHKAGAFVCVDNTVKTWYWDWCQGYEPDFIIESLSKLSNGLNASLLGFLYCKDNTFLEQLHDLIRTLGFYANEFDLYLTLCNLQTAPLRMQRISKTSSEIGFMLQEVCDNFKSFDLSGLFFFDIPKSITRENVSKLFASFDVIQAADTFGTSFTVASHWKNLNKIRISIGLEDKNDLIEDFMKIVNFIS